MKLSATNRIPQNLQFKGVTPNKLTKTAYSALFTLTLLSGGNKIIQDTFTKEQKTKTEQPGQYNSVNKAQSVYTDMWGRSWVPYSEYQELEDKTYNAEIEKNELESESDRINDLYYQTEDYYLRLKEKYETIQKDLETQSIRQEYRIDKINETEENIIKKLDRLLECFFMGLFPAFALTLGIGTIRKLNKMDDKNNYLRK